MASDGERVVVHYPVVGANPDDEQGVADDLVCLLLPHRLSQPLRVLLEVAQLLLHGHYLRQPGGEVVEAGAPGGKADAGGRLGEVEAVGGGVGGKKLLEAQVGDEEVGDQPAVGEPPRGSVVREIAAVGDVVSAE